MLRALELAAHGTIIATVGTLAIALYNGTLFAWHPILMSIGFLGAMGEGAITALKFRAVEGPPRASAIMQHFWMQLLAVAAVSGGFWAIYQNKVNNGKSHFKTTHGKFGLVTIILTAAAPLGGILSFRRFGLLPRLPVNLQAHVKWLHRKVGLAAWLLALVTIQLGLSHPSVNKGILTLAWQAAVVLIGLLVCVMAYTEQHAAPALPQTSVEMQRLADGNKQMAKAL